MSAVGPLRIDNLAFLEPSANGRCLREADYVMKTENFRFGSI